MRRSNNDAGKPKRRSTSDAQRLNAGKPKRSSSPSRKGVGFGRSKSVEVAMTTTHWSNIKGIMKLKTLDESLHSVYGSESSQASDDGKRKKRINIQFENIEIREYARTVGDNPSVSSGPPITIAWEYNPNTTVLSIEEYEKARPVRRTQSQMILPRSVRVDLLKKEWDVSNSQIVRAVRSGVRAKNQRRTTLGNLGRTDKVEEMLEGATKKLLKTLFLRKSTSTRAQELENEIQRVSNQRAQIVLERTMKEDESVSSCPWASDLQLDESETEAGGSRGNLPDGKNERRDDRFRSSSNSKDETIRKPDRPEHSVSEVDMSSSSIGDLEERHVQSTGESACQTPDATRSRFVITAVEPDEDLIGPKESGSSMPKDPGTMAVDC